MKKNTFIKQVKFPENQLSGGKNLLIGRLSNTPGQKHNSGIKENRGGPSQFSAKPFSIPLPGPIAGSGRRSIMNDQTNR